MAGRSKFLQCTGSVQTSGTISNTGSLIHSSETRVTPAFMLNTIFEITYILFAQGEDLLPLELLRNYFHGSELEYCLQQHQELVLSLYIPTL